MKGKNLLILVLVLIMAAAVLVGLLIWGRDGDSSVDSQPTKASATQSISLSTGTKGTQPHTHTYSPMTVAPDCLQAGYTLYSCSCGDQYTGDEIPALGHAWGEWLPVKSATEEQEGLSQRTCSRCNASEEQAIPKLDPAHTCSYETKVVVPDCTEEGYTVRFCAVCGQSQTSDYVAALGHDFGQWKQLDTATCEKEGREERICAQCGNTETRTTTMLGHDYKTVTKAATCTEQGSVTKTCNRCGKVVTETTPATGHSFGDWVPKSTANCTTGGEEYRNCTDCGETETRTVAPGHSWGEWEVTKPATKNEAGERTRTCRACGKTETQEVSRNDGHTHEWEETVIEPTCEERGYTLKTCKVCGYSYEKPGSSTTDEHGSQGHNWTDWVTIVAPTTNSTGEEQRTCRYCGEVQKSVIPKLDEDGEAYESYIDPAIEVKTGPRGSTSYTYNALSVKDYRTWGEAPSIWVNEDGSLTVVFHNIEGAEVEVIITPPPEGYVRSLYIDDDGSYYINTVGQPS